SIYYVTEKVSSGGDGETELITVRVRAFPPCGVPLGKCGRAVINALEPITLGTLSFDAEKHEGKIYKSYVDVSVTYRLPRCYTAFFDTQTRDGYQIMMSSLVIEFNGT
ncbi:MAG: hypothetical protein LUH54_02205, partial [Firmicutes bacterium]|nr:hypothetical protein [Bacillota bacterium]